MKRLLIAGYTRGLGRVQEGDVIDVFPDTHAGLGEKEGLGYFTVRVPDNVAQTMLEAGLLSNLPLTRKRFSLPLATLAAQNPTLDLDRLRNPIDRYRPFEGAGRANAPITQAHIIDKAAP